MLGNKVSEQPQAKLPLKKEAKTLAPGKVIAKKNIKTSKHLSLCLYLCPN